MGPSINSQGSLHCSLRSKPPQYVWMTVSLDWLLFLNKQCEHSRPRRKSHCISNTIYSFNINTSKLNTAPTFTSTAVVIYMLRLNYTKRYPLRTTILEPRSLLFSLWRCPNDGPLRFSDDSSVWLFTSTFVFGAPFLTVVYDHVELACMRVCAFCVRMFAC